MNQAANQSACRGVKEMFGDILFLVVRRFFAAFCGGFNGGYFTFSLFEICWLTWSDRFRLLH